jgi:hypothetical protein
MKDLKTTTALVHSILEEDEKARNSDSYLYLRVLNTVADKEHINLNEIHVIDFLLNLSKSPFPPFESVRRTRQKLQEKLPHLAPCKAVEELRAENEVAFLEYARS